MANQRPIDALTANPIGSPKWMQAVHAILTEHAALPHVQPQDHQQEQTTEQGEGQDG